MHTLKWTSEMERAFQKAIRNEGLRRLDELRHEIKNAFVNLEVLLLRPLCFKCETTIRSAGEDHAFTSSTRICSSREAISCIYDPVAHHVSISIDEKDQKSYQLICDRCGHALDIHHNSEIPAEPAYFGEHFCVANSPDHPPTAFKQFLKSTYGNKCAGCRIEFQEDDLTMDHVVARANGGDGSPLVLQVVCRFCQEMKVHRPAKTVQLYLDFLLVPERASSPRVALTS